MLEERTIKIPAKVNKKIHLKAIPGHFATTHSHINHYLDMTSMKNRHTEALEVAKELVKNYSTTKIVDTIVCMDGCEVIGAYLAQELTAAGIMSLNSHECVNVITPEINSKDQLIFRDNIQKMVMDKHVVLLLASASTGKTIKSCLRGIRYYGGIIEGIAALFSAVDTIEDIKVDTIFTQDDVDGYENYTFTECPYCKAQRKLDALVNSYGYSRI